MSILVTPLSRLAEQVFTRTPARVISVLDPGSAFPELGPAFDSRHLRLAFHDVHVPAPGVTAPTAAHVATLLAFLDDGERDELLLIHCRAGIGRSTATAFVTACHRNPHTSELVIAEALRRVAPFARPNEVIVSLADAAMSREGRMWSAIADTGRDLTWEKLPEPQPFELPSRY